MAERLYNETLISLAYEINLQTGIDSFVVHPDFDWNSKTPPYYVVRPLEVNENPGFMRGQIHEVDPVYDVFVTVVGANQTDVRKKFGSLQQVLRTATGVASGVYFYSEDYPGLPLRDSEAAVPGRVVGVLNIDFPLGSDEGAPIELSEHGSLRHTMNLAVRLSPIHKDVTKDLL